MLKTWQICITVRTGFMVLWRNNSPKAAEDGTQFTYGVPTRTRNLFPIECIYSPVYLLMLQLVILTLREADNTTEMQTARVKFVEF